MTARYEDKIVIAGCGPGSADYLTPLVCAAAAHADVLVGANRLLALFPAFAGIRLPVGADTGQLLDKIAGHVEARKRVVVLVTGDPGICSLARPVIQRFGADRCRVIPGISAVQAAFAGLALDWTGARIVNAHAETPALSAKDLARENTIAVVGGNARTWPWVLALADALSRTHALNLCSEMGLPGESIRPLEPQEIMRLEPGAGMSILVWNRRKDLAPDEVRSGDLVRHVPRVYFVGAGPGDPDLLTRKAERLLRSCRCCIWAGSLVNPALLDLLPPDCEKHDSSRLTLDEIIAVIEKFHGAGMDVVRLHTGEPALFGAIAEQMARLDDLGIPYDLIPGISSFQAAAAAVKRELTAPEVAQAVVLARASGRTPVPPAHTLERIAPLRATLCVYLSTDRVQDVVAALKPHYGDTCPAAVIYHASWPDERVVWGTLANIAGRVREAGLTRTGMILVGDALAGAAAASRLYAADFAHGYRRASGEEEGDC